MDANRREFSGPLGAEVFKVVGCAFAVINELGHGLLEKPYENAIAVEFKLNGIPFDQQKAFPIQYKGHSVGVYIPDLIAFNSIVVDTKVIDKITDIERAQILNYLRITGHKVGLILNFKRPRLEWERLILDKS